MVSVKQDRGSYRLFSDTGQAQWELFSRGYEWVAKPDSEGLPTFYGRTKKETSEKVAEYLSR